MKFSDNIIRKNLEIVHVIRTKKEMEAREEYGSLLWDEVKKAFLPKDRSKNLYSTPCRDVKIGESIYDENGQYISYRSE